MPLRPVTIDDALLGRRLPWDVYTVSGVLVASAGMVVDSTEQLHRLNERPLFRQAGGEGDGLGFTQRIDTLFQHYPTALRVAGSSRLEPLIRLMAQEIMRLAELDHDATFGILRLQANVDPAIRHCLLVALLAQDMAKLLLPSGSPLVEPTTCAALTMNIAAMRMHADLEDQPQPLNWMQRDSIDQHPGDSLLMLQAGGLRDPDWLKAVAQHHENLDGTGYPKQLRGDEVVIAARILRLADFYVAKIRSRRYRPAETTRTAFRNIFGKERSRLDGKIALVLLRKLGLYPPGTLMRLANKEIAVVVRKQGNGESAGRVVVFLAPNGRLLKQPLERNTSQTDFAILNITEIESEWPDIRWPRFWGY